MNSKTLELGQANLCYFAAVVEEFYNFIFSDKTWDVLIIILFFTFFATKFLNDALKQKNNLKKDRSSSSFVATY